MNRTMDEKDLTILKRVCRLWAIVGVPTGTTPVLQRWNYPQLGQSGGVVRTYTTAPTAAAALGFPNNYLAGADGVFSVTRTATGLWTIKLQDNYQRVLQLKVDMSIAGGLANIVAIGENSTISSMQAANGSVIGVALLSSTGTAADPTAAASSLVRICIDLQDATEP